MLYRFRTLENNLKMQGSEFLLAVFFCAQLPVIAQNELQAVVYLSGNIARHLPDIEQEASLFVALVVSALSLPSLVVIFRPRLNASRAEAYRACWLSTAGSETSQLLCRNMRGVERLLRSSATHRK